MKIIWSILILATLTTNTWASERICRSLAWDIDVNYLYCADIETLVNKEFHLTNITIKHDDHNTHPLIANKWNARMICQFLVTGKKIDFTKSASTYGADWDGSFTAHATEIRTPEINNGYYHQPSQSTNYVRIEEDHTAAFESLDCKR